MPQYKGLVEDAIAFGKAQPGTDEEKLACTLDRLFVNFGKEIVQIVPGYVSTEAGATLISPFVGRIMDWWKKKEGKDGYAAAEDPGVLSVQNIYRYYKAHGYKTIVMGASFRNKGEILELAGVDRLTIAPALLDKLKASTGEVKCVLEAKKAAAEWKGDKVDVSEPSFRFMMNEDACATDKTAEGIRGFSADLRKLEDVIKGM